jgi:hypothetical protein
LSTLRRIMLLRDLGLEPPSLVVLSILVVPMKS